MLTPPQADGVLKIVIKIFLFTEAVPTVPYEILKMEKMSGTDIWRLCTPRQKL
jgi:hypothetical protein